MKKIFVFINIYLFLSTIPNLKCQTHLWKIDSKKGCGFINKDGRIIIKPKYDLLSMQFDDGLAWFKKNNKTGYIDTCGKVVLYMNTSCYNFNEGLAPSFIDNKLCFITKAGKIAFYPKYYDYNLGSNLFSNGIPNFSEGLAAIIMYKENLNKIYFIYINKNGINEFDKIYSIAKNFSEGLAFIKDDDEQGYINKKGDLEIKLKGGQYGEDFSEGFASVLDTNNNFFYINKKGNRICESIFKKAYPFSDGVAKIKIQEKYGYIDSLGTIIIKPIYDNASDFYRETAFVSTVIIKNYINSYSTSIINKAGKVLFGPFNDILLHYSKNELAFCTNYIKEQADYQIYLNLEGKIVWQCPKFGEKF